MRAVQYRSWVALGSSGKLPDLIMHLAFGLLHLNIRFAGIWSSASDREVPTDTWSSPIICGVCGKRVCDLIS